MVEPAVGSSLADHLRRRIALEGPLSLAVYMETALLHPRLGYYATRDPFGQAGDFVTAPEISQMFGELIGACLAQVWQEMGRPYPVRLIEFGPGRGTLMADVLRAARHVPDFLSAIRVHLVEASPTLRARQEETLRTRASDAPIEWHGHLGEVPEGPLLVVANEFFDALPIRQYRKSAEGWRERLVDVNERGDFVFVHSPPQSAPPSMAAESAAVGDVIEVSSAAIGLADTLARRIVDSRGAALVIDYGPTESAPGDSFQAVHRHRFADPLIAPGESDLTAHVDFAALNRVARDAGADVFGPMAQGEFLRRLGIDVRAERLSRDVSPARAAEVAAARARLVEATGMGTLFKAVAWQSPGLARPPAF